MSNKKIAIISHEYYPVLCGGSVFAEKMAEEWAALGYEPEILTAGVGWKFTKVESNSKFKVRRFRTLRFSRRDARFWELALFGLLGLPQIFFYVLRNRFDLLFSVFAVPAGLMALVISKILRIPSFVFVDAADVPKVDSAQAKHSRLISFLLPIVANRSDGVIVLQGLEDLAMPYIQNPRTVIIPNGTSIPTQVASVGGRSSQRLEILSVGRIVARKGFLELVESLGELKKTDGNFRITIVGYGTMENEVTEAIRQRGLEEQIRMVGRVEYKKLGQYYLDSDCYLFYGKREGSSLAMIEAMAYGLPIIATDEPGNRNYVADGKNGYLIDPTRSNSLASCIEKLIKNRDQLPEMGRESRARAEGVSWARIAKDYDRFFEEQRGS